MNRSNNSRAGQTNGTLPAERSPERTAIAAAKRGQWDGIHYLYARHADDVFCCVLSIVRERHEAEDITQNVFLELGSEITGYEEERSAPFATWIMGVARSATVRPAPEERR